MRNYELFRMPVECRLQDLTLRDARKYFSWFVAQIPGRLAQLQTVVRENGAEELSLDFTPESLGPLGTWLAPHAYEEELPDSYVTQARSKMPAHLQFVVSKSGLSYETLSLCVDIGIYFGEVLIRCNEGLQWDTVTRPKAMQIYTIR